MDRIGIVRHGRTAWNLERRAQGSSDIPLDAEGQAGAALLAERLKDGDWDIIYSSDLSRANQTAEAVAAASGLEVRIDPRIREVSGGQIEGTTEEERIAKWGPDWRDEDRGIETRESATARGMEFIHELMETHSGGNVLLVSHGGLIRHLLRAMLPELPEGEIGNTSLTVLKRHGNEWKCELFSCTEHLEHSVR
ncbi:histidine phosphatase family protein [Indiicoccus explosivorum]|uniref:histidine phosphatase family protein n=1 Tax=Indiicoccus explosivorum TaxID=1917864 RepID=UPI000B4386C1|nr:histidine phosphatase family protein [Indiicoccus explosivorum]